jgi:hypothetical protein
MSLPTPEAQTEVPAPVIVSQQSQPNAATPTIVTALAASVIPVPGA